MLSIEQALQNILPKLTPSDASEDVDLIAAHHRILAEAPVAGIDVPPMNVSAMDGYAIHTDDLTTAQQQGLPISQRIPAGSPPQPLQAHTAARIFTGSVIPSGANAVTIQEDCDVEANVVRLKEAIKVGENIRRQGQDTKINTPLLAAGHRLRAQDLGLLASVGIARVRVKRRIKVAIIASGDELMEPGTPLSPGKIYNSNRYTLHGLLQNLDAIIDDRGRIPDSLEQTQHALQKAASSADCIITTGGVSVGEEDHLKAAVQNVGALALWKLAIKPGKPLAYGNVQGVPFFGLPGNPVAVLVTFLLIVRPALMHLQGQHLSTIKKFTMPTQQWPAAFTINEISIREEYLRVRIEDGKIVRYPTQDSSILSSTSWANALAVVPSNTRVSPGDLLEVIPFDWFNL